MQGFMLWSHRHPAAVVIILLATTIFFAYYIPAIKVDVSLQTLWIKGDPAKDFYDDTLDKFGSDKITVIFVKE